MAGKSFKDYYSEDKVAPKKEVKPEAIAEEYKEEEEQKVTVIEGDSIPTPQEIAFDDTELREVLSETRKQNSEMIKSVSATNKKIAESVEKLVESNSAINEKLVEAISALTDKIELLETKLEAIENLEIPTPIVNLSMPNKRVEKKVHRDKKGIITHITESELFDEDDDGDE